MATKTLRVTLADILGVAGPSGRVHGEVWARFVDGNGAPREVRYTDGTLVTLAAPRVPLNSSGYADFVVVPNDDATIQSGDQGFGIQVGWDLTTRGARGTTTPITNTGKTVAVTSASPAIAQYGLLASYTPIIPGTSYITQSTADAAYAAQQVSGKGIARVVNRADYASLAAAITAAGSGGTIFYPDGSNYAEPATTISAPLTIDGRRATITKSANGTLFTVTTAGFRVTKGVTIDGAGSTYTGAGVVFSGNGTTTDPKLDGDIINCDKWCVDVGIGAAQRGKFLMSMASTRQRTVTDAAITAGATTLTSATAAFTSNDVGKCVFIVGAQDAVNTSWVLLSVITAFTNSTTVTILDAANVTVSGATCDISSPAFRFGAETGSGVTGDRTIGHVTTGGFALADFGGAQTINVFDTNSRGVIFSSSSCVKVNISGANRIATSGGATIVRGTNHTIAGSTLAGDLVFDTTAADCAEGGNVTAGSVIDKGTRTRVARMGAGTTPYTVDPRNLSSASALNANQAVFLRVTGSGYISKVGFHVGTASGNVCVGVYSNNGSAGTAARPVTRKATSGSVTCPAAGYAEIALGSSVYVQEGDWLAIVADNATATFYRSNANGFSTNLALGVSHHQSSAFPLPSSASVSSGSMFSVILTGVV